MSASHDDLISQFSGVTGTDTERARFYLESSGWQLEVALASFYDDGDPVDAPMEPSPAPAEIQSQASSQGRSVSNPPSRFATIGSMRQQSQDSSDEEGGQEFYAGGEHSGEVIVGPGKKKKADKLVEEMFKSAREHGAEEVQAGGSAGRQPSTSFVGSGFKLGDTENAPSQKVTGARGPTKEIDVILKLWKNGFSVGDGPLRDFNDPQNKEFLDSIHKGEVPQELIRMAKGGEVNLNMEDHRTEEYEAPKVEVKAFTGAGHMLGSVAPTVASEQPASQNHEESAKSSLAVDSSKPTTQIQIRLSDGSRLVAKLNHSHTVADIRNYIITARPHFSGTNFVLMTTFPNKELTDPSATLESASLLNAVIVQRMK